MGITLPEAWERRENLTNSKRRRTTRLPSIALLARQNQAWLGPALAGTSNNFSGSVDLNQRDLTVRDHFLRPAWGLT